MPALENPRHEAFCQQYARTGNAVQSYLSVYKDSSYEAAGVSSSRLLEHAGILARVSELNTSINRRLQRLDVKQRKQRLEILDDLVDRMRRVIEARAEDMKNVPGGDTGLMVRQVKKVGDSVVEEYAVDTGLMRETREFLKQSAVEVGEWTEKKEIGGNVGVYDASKIENAPAEQLHKLLEAWQEALKAAEQKALPAPATDPGKSEKQ